MFLFYRTSTPRVGHHEVATTSASRSVWMWNFCGEKAVVWHLDKQWKNGYCMDKTCACLSEFRHKYATKSQFSFTNKLKTLKELLYPLPLPPFGTMSANITAFPGSACCKALISCLTLPKWKDVISWSMLCRRWQFWSNQVRERDFQ